MFSASLRIYIYILQFLKVDGQGKQKKNLTEVLLS